VEHRRVSIRLPSLGIRDRWSRFDSLRYRSRDDKLRTLWSKYESSGAEYYDSYDYERYAFYGHERCHFYDYGRYGFYDHYDTARDFCDRTIFSSSAPSCDWPVGRGAKHGYGIRRLEKRTRPDCQRPEGWQRLVERDGRLGRGGISL